MAGINLTKHPLAANGYFYLNGKLYKIMQAVRASDYLTAWNFHDNGMEEFIMSDVRRRCSPAFKTKQVGEMMNRSSITVRDVYQADHIPRPKKTYPLDGTGDYTPLLYSPILWSKEDIYRLHDYMLSKHGIKEAEKNGIGQSGRNDIPTRAELRATLDHGTVYYVKDKQGKMVKVWKADSI